MNPALHIKETSEAVAREFAKYLDNYIKDKAVVSIALSGGSTPALLFDILAEDYQHIDWHKVHFFWGDERCVPPEHEESNYRMTRERLLDKISIPDHNVHRILGENNPEKEAERYGDELYRLLQRERGIPSFDLVILGMGPDGHTASIFPHEMHLLNSGKYCEVANHPETGQQRITLTGPVINNAQCISFLVTGDSKRERITEIFGKTDSWRSYPASFITPTSGELHWFMDESAASGLIL